MQHLVNVFIYLSNYEVFLIIHDGQLSVTAPLSEIVCVWHSWRKKVVDDVIIIIQYRLKQWESLLLCRQAMLLPRAPTDTV